MPTTASDRLDRLFANTARPKKPELSNTALKASSDPRSELSKPNVENCEKSSTPQSQIMSSSTHSVTATSDDDDEYEALFTKHAKKNRLARVQPKSGKDSTRSEDAQTHPTRKIEFFPNGKVSAEKPESKHIQKDNLEITDAYSGNGRPLIGSFCPLSLVAKLPYKYMKDPDDRVSKKFFAGNKFYQRKWSLYYLHFPQPFNKKALVLIPLSETQKLVDEISTTFDIEVSVPSFPFTIDFYDDKTPKPTFLGNSSSRKDVDELTETIPEARPDYGDCPPLASADITEAYKAFHNKVEGIALFTKAKSSSSGQRKSQKLWQTLQETRSQMNRAQRYLGLRPRSKAVELGSGLTWDEEQRIRKEKLDSCGLSFNFLDVTKVVEYPFEHEPVIIAIDVEAYERNHNIVTEIGVSTLDTLDLVDLPPGQDGENWVKQIRSRHFRIKGREQFVNKDFCIGNADAFQFGRSEHVSLIAVSDTIDSCFEWPFSVQYKKEGPSTPTHDDDPLPAIGFEKMQKGAKERNFVILGHDVGVDLEYLQKLGSEVFNPLSTDTVPEDRVLASKRHRILCSVLETVDTASLYKLWKMELQPRNLSHVCSTLGIDAWFAHNAGNDARYTLEVLIKLLIKARLEQDEGQRKRDPNSKGIVQDEWEAEKLARLDERIDKARSRVQQKIKAQLKEENTNDNNTEINWSLPLRDKKSQKPKEPEISMEEQNRRYSEAQQAESATTVWPAGPEMPLVKPPRGGW